MAAVPMMRLSTGEEISEVEWQCRVRWDCAANEYRWNDPANAERQAEIRREYVAAMQRDPRLD